MRSFVLTVLLVALAAPGRACAQDDAPATPSATEAPRRHVVMHEQLVGLLNPMGAEHRLDVAYRAELGADDDLFTQGTHLEIGASTAVSPVYAFGGGYVQLSPLSFLVLRGDLQGAGVWPIGMDGAGFYAVPGYDAEVQNAALPADRGGSASGWLAQLTVTLQGAIDLGGGARLLGGSELALAFEEMGSAPYYDSMKHDAIMARDETILLSSTFVGVELPVASDLVLRWGAYDDLRFVPASGYVGHQLGPLAMLEWHHVTPQIASLGVFARGGGYTHHLYRAGEATVLVGVAIDFDLGDLR